MKRLLILLPMLLLLLTAAAQKKELIEDKPTILKRAAESFDAMLLPGAPLHEAVVKEQLNGRFVLQVSFREKGDISSVFVVSAEAHDTRSQNRFKDLVHQQALPFKMPKGQQYRIEHAFDLNALRR